MLNYLLHIGYLYGIIVLFPIFGYVIHIVLKNYSFKYRTVNNFLIINMFFSNPIGILCAIAFSGLMSLDNRIFHIGILWNYLYAAVIIILVGGFKLFILQQALGKENFTFKFYSKEFIIQLFYLIFLFYPWWYLHDMDFAFGIGPILIFSEIVSMSLIWHRLKLKLITKG